MSKVLNEHIYETEITIIRIFSKVYGIKDFIIDSDDNEKCLDINWCVAYAGKDQRKDYYYALSRRDGKAIFLHRFIMDCPIKMVVDHINGDTFDNRKENLRVVTHQQNCLNRRINYNNTSGTKGVVWNKKEDKWMAFIQFPGYFKNLGYFDSIDDAIVVRKEAEKNRDEYMQI